MLQRPGTRKVPPAPSHANTSAFPAAGRKPGRLSVSCLSRNLAALTTESRRHQLVNALEKPGREATRACQAGTEEEIRLDGLERVMQQETSASQKGWVLLHETPHAPNILGWPEATMHRLCSEAEMASLLPERPSGGIGVGGKDCRQHCQGRGGHLGRESPAFWELQSEPAELKCRTGGSGASSCPCQAWQAVPLSLTASGFVA